MTPVSTIMMAASGLILLVFALAFIIAGRGRGSERYWSSWAAANVALAAAMGIFATNSAFSPAFLTVVPNALLLFGFGLRWRAARQFSGRAHSFLSTAGPGIAFLAMAPLFVGSYRVAFVLLNVTLAVQTAAIAIEFLRDREEASPSRIGLAIAYGMIAFSTAARAFQGVFLQAGMPLVVPDEWRLQVHLIAALVHATASGAFALSIAYERTTLALNRAANTDALTDLPNRRAFDQRLREVLAAPHPQYALALFDVDHFKQVNDRHGHSGGDSALCSVAAVLDRAKPDGAFLARIGGEEFAMLVPATSEAQAAIAVDAVRLAVKKNPAHHAGHAIAVTVSAGLYHMGTVGAVQEFDKVMRVADHRLYLAKSAGRDRVVGEQAAAAAAA